MRVLSFNLQNQERSQTCVKAGLQKSRSYPYTMKGTYKGVIEVSQDITQIKKLEGERRLLDW